jgi:hypothetical protein
MKIKELMKWTVLLLLLISSIHSVSAISLSSIPQTGVWVRVIYPGNFTGSIESDGKMIPVSGSVDQYYQVPTVDGIVTAILQKEDYSINKITVEIYKNGGLLKRETNEIPNGIVGIQFDLKSLQTLTTVTITSQPIIPQTGVWVRVIYPGTYTGLIGIPNDLHASTDSGDHFYQILTTNGTVAVSLQKTDGSSDKLTVEIYLNGVLVEQKSTIAPKGILEFQFDLKSFQILTTVTTTSQPIIPQTGVWVRVIYPGNFTGSIGSTGKMKPVTGSIDQVYQVPTIDETVTAVFQKKDNSTNKITLEVYNNEVFLQRKTSEIPQGIVEIWLNLKSLPTLTTVTTTSQPIIPQTKSVDENQQLGEKNDILTQITNFFKKMFAMR